ncbi:transcription factor LHW-like [Macadamia integrifolia]|uniref:transcription factor LHW-like n=1 Tax=Macadamia integrifolia TaxID=60698 RepID=UPI001C4E9235|nr:transcription factor LHW-like [Macadamia integrifolia]
MSSRRKEELKSLCCNNGWSYGVFWSTNRRNSLLLTLEDAYYDDQMGMEIDKMLPQVHLLGEGIIGQAAFTGKHRWLFLDACCGARSPSGYVVSQDVFQDNSELHHLFSSGIKTVAVISVAPQGVVQFGSTKKILERLEFVDHTQSLFRQIESIDKLILLQNAQRNLKGELYDPCGSFASVVLSGNSYSSYGNIKPSHDDSCKDQMVKSHSSLIIPQSSAFTSEWHRGSMSTLIGNQFNIKSQYQMEGVEAQMTLTKPSMQLPQGLSKSYSSCTENTVHRLQTMSFLSCEGSTLNSFEPKLLGGAGMCVTPKVPSANLHTPVSYQNSHVDFQGESTFQPLGSIGRSLDPVSDKGIIEGNKTSRYGTGELVDSQPLAFFTHPAEDELPEVSSCFPTFTGESRSSNATSAVSEPNPVYNLSQLGDPPLQQGNNGLALNVNFSKPLVVPGNHSNQAVTPAINNINSPGAVCDRKGNSSNAYMQMPAVNDLFDNLGLDFSSCQSRECWDDVLLPLGTGGCPSLSTRISECISELEVGSMAVPQRGFFSGEQLLNDVVCNFNSVTNPSSEDSATTITRTGSSTGYCNQIQLAGLSPLGGNMDVVLPEYNNLDKIKTPVIQKEIVAKSQVGSWIDDSYSMNAESAVVTQPKRTEEPATVTKKRARPGESTRPRPKDRQQIQDRIKELREIVPNGGKCSIDALLDRTIKYMLFLQSVNKYANQLKKDDEPKMIGDESCVILKDNASGDGCGATWAFEVGGQTMVCPIIVEDLGPPRQMLIKMHCEEQGFFLEIADIIQGIGLTILKGVIEVREDKFWARFVVEASKEVTRMDVFLSLVHLLQQTVSSGVGSSNQQSKVVDGEVPLFNNFQQSSMPLPVRLVDGMQ